MAAMATDFDALRALREEINGLAGVGAALAQAERQFVLDAENAERQLNATRKLQGFLALYREYKLGELSKLEQEH